MLRSRRRACGPCPPSRPGRAAPSRSQGRCTRPHACPGEPTRPVFSGTSKPRVAGKLDTCARPGAQLTPQRRETNAEGPVARHTRDDTDGQSERFALAASDSFSHFKFLFSRILLSPGTGAGTCSSPGPGTPVVRGLLPHCHVKDPAWLLRLVAGEPAPCRSAL